MPAEKPAPAAEPASEEPATDEAADDAFKPAEQPAAPSDDPFGSARLDLPRRAWTDDTGEYTIEARLLVVLDGKVRLLKDTGRTTTVPLDRLSETDRQYVDHVVAQYGRDAINQVATK